MHILIVKIFYAIIYKFEFLYISSFFLFPSPSHSSNPNKQSMTNVITYTIIEAWV